MTGNRSNALTLADRLVTRSLLSVAVLFASVLTTDLLADIWADIVGSYATPLSFTDETNKVKDQDSAITYPVAVWALPTTALQPVAEVYDKTFALSILFIDQTATDRTATEMRTVHSRMETIANHCWIRFHDFYIASYNTFDGVPIDIELVEAPVFTPVYDEGTSMRTGVALSATVKASGPECVDGYFA